MLRTANSVLLLASLLFIVSWAGAQELVKDIHPGISTGDHGSRPDHFVTIGQTGYFAAEAPVPEDTMALWKTDGTAAGTALVKVLVRGANINAMIAVGATVYFIVGSSGVTELWRSDGTTSGTAAFASFLGSYSVTNLSEFNGALFFAGRTNAHGNELWTSDGTLQGTVLFADINPTGHSLPSRLVPDGHGNAYFNADDGAEGRELWQLDGSTGSLIRHVIRPGPEGSDPLDLTSFGPSLYFSADDGVVGRELFQATGRRVTLAADIAPGVASSQLLGGLYVAGNTLFFSANDGTTGQELWKVSSTGSVQLVADIHPGGSSAPNQFLAVGGEVYFGAYEPQTGSELWKSSGTATSTVLVADLVPGPGHSFPTPMAVIPPATLLVRAGAPSGVWAVPTTRGTPSVVAGGWASAWNAELVAGQLLFAFGPQWPDMELWISDGTLFGTKQLAELVPPRPESSEPSELTVVNGEVYFSASSPGAGVELWKSDGTAGGTVMVHDIAAGPLDSVPTRLTEAGGQLFFYANDYVNGVELWVSDGTTATLVQNIGPGSTSGMPSSGIGTLAKSGSRHVVFAANDGQNGWEPWVSDGTPGGTTMLADINPSGSSSITSPHFVRLNGLTYFVAADAQGGSGLWSTDNTPAGTMLVRTFAVPGAVPEMIAVGNALFFSAYGPGEGIELWTSDGTAGGTRQVTSIAPGAYSSDPRWLTALSGLVVFSAWDGGTTGRELWVSDGTAAGTRMLADIAPGPNWSEPFELIVADNMVFFSAWEPTGGRELYWTNGSTIVSRVVDVATGPQSALPFMRITARTAQPMPRRIAPLGSSSRATFAALDELWASDRTAAGTRQVGNLAPDPWGSDPSNLVRIGRQIFFSAYTPNAGRELWVIDVATAGGLLVEDYGTSSVTSLGQRAVIRRVGWPTIGNAGFETKLRFALPNTPASLLVAAAPGAVPLGAGTCTLYVASPLVPLATTTDANGEVRVKLPIPNNPALVGGELFLQYLFVDAGGCFSNLVSLTHGMQVLINF